MPESLEMLQRRFFAAITGRTAVAEGLLPRVAAAWIQARTPEEATRRLATYAEMHRLRMLDVLRDDYLRVHAALGDVGFAELAMSYLENHPSRSSTLHELGDAFAPFVARHPRGRARPELAEIARLDAARNRVFDAEDDVALTPADLSGWDVDAWQACRVRRISALDILHAELNLAETWLAYDTRVAPPAVRPARQTLLVWRAGFVVRHREIDEAEERLLGLLTAPISLAALCEHFGDLTDGAQCSAEQTFQRLHQWLTDGLLTRA